MKIIKTEMLGCTKEEMIELVFDSAMAAIMPHVNKKDKAVIEMMRLTTIEIVEEAIRIARERKE